MGRKGGRTWPRGGRNLGLQRHGGSPRYGSLLIKQVTLDQLLEEFIPVQLTNHGAGIVVIGDISGVFSQEIPDNLIDGIVALFLKGLIDGSQDVPNFCILFVHNAEFSGEIIHTDTAFLLSMKIVYSV